MRKLKLLKLGVIIMKKNEKFIIRPGKTCILDAQNILNQDCTGVVHVEVLREVKSTIPFQDKRWEVIGAGPDKNILTNPVVVPERLLQPSGMVVIRYPSDIPIINDNDIRALDTIIKAFDDTPRNVPYVTIPQKSSVDINRLKALREKLILSMKMKEV